MQQRPLSMIDFYKADHRPQYPNGTSRVYANFTPRSSKHAPVLRERFDDRVVLWGLQGAIKTFLIDTWNEGFFLCDKKEVVAEYKRRMDTSLGPDAISMEHIEALHDLGHLPILIKALPEGSRVNIGVPMFTIENTVDEFFWLTNYLETALSALVWKSCTIATIANEYRKLMVDFADKTGCTHDHIQFQCHDFSMRGMSGLEDAAMNNSGHLLSFVGTDSVPAIDYMEDYYNANAEKELIGASVPATEHSVMCMGTREGEIETFRRLIEDLYPTGVISIVSDTWDFWQVLTEFLPQLKDVIMNRQPNALGLNKVVIRPDSGDPVKIICGDPDAPFGTPERKGAVECLWEVFGGTTNEEGYDVLDEHIGLIYGDSITLERAQEILERLKSKGFAASNIVFGVGSYTYQYLTRDTFGFAVKATYGVVNGEPREISKDPATDDGTKKSAKGLLCVTEGPDGVILENNVTRERECQTAMRTVFLNGGLYNEQSLSEVRALLHK